MIAGDCAAQVKHLRTLGMDQVAAAIRTHGMGLADNAVNVTYQFLARKVNMLSEVSASQLRVATQACIWHATYGSRPACEAHARHVGLCEHLGWQLPEGRSACRKMVYAAALLCRGKHNPCVEGGTERM